MKNNINAYLGNCSYTYNYVIKKTQEQTNGTDWATQSSIDDQTCSIYSTNRGKKTKITVRKNVKGW